MAFTEYEVKYRNIKVKISDGTIITGQINILTFTRLSEYLKQSNDKFIVVTDQGAGEQKKATLINKEHIVWADTWE